MFQMFIEDRVWPSERNFEVLLFDAYIERRQHQHHSTSNFLDDTSQEVEKDIELPLFTSIGDSKMLSPSVQEVIEYNGKFPPKLDTALMDRISSATKVRIDAIGSFGQHILQGQGHSKLLRRPSTSSAVMESVYLTFYTRKKMFSTRHRFAMNAAKDALHQSELMCDFLSEMQSADFKFVQACASAKKNHEPLFRWQQDKSQLSMQYGRIAWCCMSMGG